MQYYKLQWSLPGLSTRITMLLGLVDMLMDILHAHAQSLAWNLLEETCLRPITAWASAKLCANLYTWSMFPWECGSLLLWRKYEPRGCTEDCTEECGSLLQWRNIYGPETWTTQVHMQCCLLSQWRKDIWIMQEGQWRKCEPGKAQVLRFTSTLKDIWTMQVHWSAVHCHSEGNMKHRGCTEECGSLWWHWRACGLHRKDSGGNLLWGLTSPMWSQSIGIILIVVDPWITFAEVYRVGLYLILVLISACVSVPNTFVMN